MSLERLTCPFPENINPLTSGGFMLSIQKFPEAKFWCTQANLPGLTLPEAPFATRFNQVPTPGDTLTFDSLEVRFLIDADMGNYKKVWNWIYSLGFPDNNTDFSNFVNSDTRGVRGNYAKTVSDGALTILNNSNVAIETVQFIDLWPTSITSLQLQSDNSDTVYLACDATFRFSHWKFT